MKGFLSEHVGQQQIIRQLAKR